MLQAVEILIRLWTVAAYILVSAFFGISTGLGAVIGFNPYLLSASVLSAVSLGG